MLALTQYLDLAWIPELFIVENEVRDFDVRECNSILDTVAPSALLPALGYRERSV